MTNNKAILRKSVFSAIYIIVLIAFTYYLYDIFYPLPSSGLLFAAVILPVAVIILIRKIIQYVIYVLSVYNSDVEFECYKDTKKVIPKNRQKLLKVITIITAAGCLAICIYSGLSMLYLKNAHNKELQSQVTLTNLSNIDCKISDSDMRRTESMVIWPAKMYRDLSTYDLSGRTTKDGEMLEDEYAHVILYDIKNFPKWYLKVYFNTRYEEMLTKVANSKQQAEITEIKNEDYHGYCFKRHNQADFGILIMNDRDLVYISIGSAQDAVKVKSDEVIELAVLLLED